MDNPPSVSPEPPEQVTITCGSCHRTVDKWTTVQLQPEQVHDDKIEITDAIAITRLCGYCIDQLLTRICFAVEAVVESVRAA